jgi:RNA-directed DNA polymerase
MSRVTKANGDTLHLWSSQDALVLKILAETLPQHVSLHPACTHIKGHGGLKATVRQLQRALPEYQFVMKTDVKGYYASIDHTILLNQLAKDTKSPYLFRLICQYVKRTVEHGGLYRDIQRGITRGCALSPVIGAYYLRVLDEKLTTTDLHYARYMDDIVVLTKTRWQLRRAVCTLNQVFNRLKCNSNLTKPSLTELRAGLIFWGITSALGHSRLRPRHSAICGRNVNGFMSNSRQALSGTGGWATICGVG